MMLTPAGILPEPCNITTKQHLCVLIFIRVLHAVKFSFKLILISVRTVIFFPTELLTRGSKDKVSEITFLKLCKCLFRINTKNEHNA